MMAEEVGSRERVESGEHPSRYKGGHREIREGEPSCNWDLSIHPIVRSNFRDHDNLLSPEGVEVLPPQKCRMNVACEASRCAEHWLRKLEVLQLEKSMGNWCIQEIAGDE